MDSGGQIHNVFFFFQGNGCPRVEDNSIIGILTDTDRLLGGEQYLQDLDVAGAGGGRSFDLEGMASRTSVQFNN